MMRTPVSVLALLLAATACARHAIPPVVLTSQTRLGPAEDYGPGILDVTPSDVDLRLDAPAYVIALRVTTELGIQVVAPVAGSPRSKRGTHYFRGGAVSTSDTSLRTVSSKLPELQSWLVSVQRALALVEEAPELVEDSHAPTLDRAQGHISFRDVTFAYPSSGRVLDRVSFDIAAGLRVGIIGASGSGKSTLANLLTRFYDPGSGQILLDGRDLRSYRMSDLRRQFSIILQEPVVFSATVAENISYARPEATREAIIEAAQAAKAHDFIMTLPKGYDTPIGEGGCRLSGGQRQRLAIARAFLKDAPVLIFDEPTSAIDIHTEEEIMEATEKLVRGRTTFVIAHRLSTVKSCDLLLVLKQGRLQAITSDFDLAVDALRDRPMPSAPMERAPVTELVH